MTPRDGLLDRLPRALHSLAEPPPGAAWNLPELSDLLPRGTPLRPAAVLVALVERDQGPQVLLTRRTDALRHQRAGGRTPGHQPPARIARPPAGVG